MSRQNKVNPGQYTQRGRLTQDAAAREMMRQRTSMSPPRHQETRAPWGTGNAAAQQQEQAEPEQKAKPALAKSIKPTGPALKAKTAKKAAPTARKAGARKSAAKSATAKRRGPARKAVLARSVVKSAAPAKKKSAKRKMSAKRTARR